MQPSLSAWRRRGPRLVQEVYQHVYLFNRARQPQPNAGSRNRSPPPAVEPPVPPTLAALWAQLPVPNRQRLLGVLSQLLHRHLPVGVAPGEEVGHDAT